MDDFEDTEVGGAVGLLALLAGAAVAGVSVGLQLFAGLALSVGDSVRDLAQRSDDETNDQ